MTTTQPEQSGDGPLAGIVVVDLTRALAGPVYAVVGILAAPRS